MTFDRTDDAFIEMLASTTPYSVFDIQRVLMLCKHHYNSNAYRVCKEVVDFSCEACISLHESFYAIYLIADLQDQS